METFFVPGWMLAVSTITSAVVGILAFFLKRTIHEQDKRIEKITGDIEMIKADYITKDDFFREQAKMERKLDMILDKLMELMNHKGGAGHG